MKNKQKNPFYQNKTLMFDEQIEEEPLPNFLQHSLSKPEFEMGNLNDVSLKKHFFSNQDPNPNSSDSPKTLKIRSILNQFLQMGFDISVCEKILEKINVENRDSNILMNEILDKYYNFSALITPEELSQRNVPLKNYIIPQKNLFIKKPCDNKINKNLHEKPNGKNLRSCEICYEQLPEKSFFKLQKCNHIFCNDCLYDYLKQKINSSELIKIPCPSNCPKELPEEEIKSILSRDPKLFEKYRKFKELAILNQDPNIRWCIKPSCNSFIKNNGNETKIKCLKCGQEICFKCRLAWHGRVSCVQALDNELKVYSKKFPVKNCPKCNSKIEKNGGCNHMTCSRCRHQFCWLCSKQYTRNHYAFFNVLGCPNMQYAQVTTLTSRVAHIVKMPLLFFFYVSMVLAFFSFFGLLFLPLVSFLLPLYVAVRFFSRMVNKFESLIKLVMIFALAMFGELISREMRSIRNHVFVVVIAIFGFLLSPLIFSIGSLAFGMLFLIKIYARNYRL